MMDTENPIGRPIPSARALPQAGTPQPVRTPEAVPVLTRRVADELEVALVDRPPGNLLGFPAYPIEQPPAFVLERFAYVSSFAESNPGGTWHLCVGRSQAVWVRYTAPDQTFRETSPVSRRDYGDGWLEVDDLGSAPADQASLAEVPPEVRAALAEAADYLGLPSWAESAALLELIDLESGFRPDAQNPTSSAHGLFQIVDATWEMYTADMDPPPDRLDPTWQAIIGMQNVAETYGTPERALDFCRATLAANAALAPLDLQAKAAAWIEQGYTGH